MEPTHLGSEIRCLVSSAQSFDRCTSRVAIGMSQGTCMPLLDEGYPNSVITCGKHKHM
jgi:hypothetical protein